MAPPGDHPSRPLMLAAGSPLKLPRALMTVDAGAFDLHLELTRLLWSGAAVIAVVLYALHQTS
jgi:hypothetical protein